jgi:phage-related minor tail protein
VPGGATELGVAQIPIRAILDELDKDLENAKQKVEKSMEGIAGKVTSTLGKIGGAAILGGVGAAAGAIAGIGVAAFKAGATVDEAYDTIMTKTGTTGETLKDLKDDFGTVFGNFAGNADKVADVVGELNARLGVTGPDLQWLSTQILETTKLMGGDGVQRTQLLTRVMGDWGVSVEDASGTLDKLFKTSQLTGAGMDGLMQKVVQFGAPLRLMGFTLDESVALFAKWEKEGVNAELVMGSLRIAAGKFAKDGTQGNKTLHESLMDTFKAIQGAKDETWALSEGMRVFGARAGPDMVAAIREGRFSIDDLTAAMGNSKNAIWETAKATEDWPEKWAKLKNVATLALAPIGLKLMDIASVLMDKAGPALDKVVAFISTTVVPVIQKLEPAIGMVGKAFGMLAKGDIGGFVAGLKGGLYGVAGAFGIAREKVEPLITRIGALAGTVAGFVKNVLVPFVNQHGPAIKGALIAIGAVLAAATILQGIMAITAAFNPLVLGIIAVVAVAALLGAAWAENWGGIRDKLTAFWVETAQPIFQQLVAWLQDVLPKAVATLLAIWSGVLLPALTAVWTFILTSIIPALFTLAEWLGTVLVGAVTLAAQFWTNTLQPALAAVWKFILTSVIPAISNLIDWLGTAIPKAITTAKSFWETKLQPALEAVWSFITKSLIPAIATVVEWVKDKVSQAAQKASEIWNTVLLPALTAVWAFIQNYVIPIIVTLVETWIAILKKEVEILAGIWNNILKPALWAVWDFIKTWLGPVLQWIYQTVFKELMLAIGTLKRAWEETLKPALETIWRFVKDDLGPKLQWLYDTVLTELEKWINNVKTGIGYLVTAMSTLWDWAGDLITKLGGLTGIVNGMKTAFHEALKPVETLWAKLKELWAWLQTISLPDWLTPGSPTPFELGLRGIAAALKEVNAVALDEFQARITVSGAGERGSTSSITNWEIHAHYDQVESELSLKDTIAALRMVGV